ncbi:MAG: polysaccharide deacetylase family protein [Bacilli bacterium]|nr:polysaccharide deacetylase family protein [Bacilli bacterium]
MKKKKILGVLLIILFLVVIPIVAIILLWPGFRTHTFEEQKTYIYGEDIVLDAGDVCYGNSFLCNEVHISTSEWDPKKLGEQEITYTYKYEENTFERKQIIEILDKEAPNIEVEENQIFYCPNKKVYEYHLKAIDNYDGEITDQVKSTLEEKEMLFEVEDSSHNKTQKRVEAIQKDDEKPIISLNGSAQVSIEVNGTYQESGALASDNCDGDLTSKIEIQNNINTKQAGEYKVIYKVKDEFGNEASISRTIYVYQKSQTIIPNGRIVYLTFDDGPGPYTEKLLNTLKQYNVKGTFFVTDQNLSKGYENMIKRAYEEGHTIGLHTKTHDYSQIYSSKEAYFQDLYAIQEKVKNLTGHTSYIIRFPGGSSNTVSRNYDRGTHIMSELTKAVEARGFVYFDWNVSSGDAGETTSTSKVTSNVIDGISRRNPAVVLQHDVKSFSVDAVEAIIQYGLSHGYQFLPLTKTSPTAHHGVNN